MMSAPSAPSVASRRARRCARNVDHSAVAHDSTRSSVSVTRGTSSGPVGVRLLRHGDEVVHHEDAGDAVELEECGGDRIGRGLVRIVEGAGRLALDDGAAGTNLPAFGLGVGWNLTCIVRSPPRVWFARSSTRPGRAPVSVPSRRTGSPLTKTWCIPTAYWCGASYVARSSTRGQVEDGDVGERALGDAAARLVAHAPRGQRRHLAHRLLQRQQLQVTDVAADDTGERAVAAGVRVADAGHEDAAVRRDHRPRVQHDATHVVLVHHVPDAGRAAVRLDLDTELDGEVHVRLAAALGGDVGEGQAVPRRVRAVARDADARQVAAAALRHDRLAHARLDARPQRRVGQPVRSESAPPDSDHAGNSTAVPVDVASYGYWSSVMSTPRARAESTSASVCTLCPHCGWPMSLWCETCPGSPASSAMRMSSRTASTEPATRRGCATSRSRRNARRRARAR
jgi:hypothetical protein